MWILFIVYLGIGTDYIGYFNSLADCTTAKIQVETMARDIRAECIRVQP